MDDLSNLSGTQGSEPVSKRFIQMLKDMANKSLMISAEWLASQQNMDGGWSRIPEKGSQISPSDEYSTAESLLYLYLAAEGRIPKEFRKRYQVHLRKASQYDHLKGISFILNNMRKESERAYWVRRGYSGSEVPGPFHTAKIAFDLSLLGSSIDYERILEWLKSIRLEEGWEFTVGENVPSPMATANVIMMTSLLAYKGILNVDLSKFFQKELVFLKNEQERNERNGYGAGWGRLKGEPPNSGATAIVLRGLAEMSLHDTEFYMKGIKYIKGSLHNDLYYPDTTPDRMNVRNTAWSVIALLLSGESPISPYVLAPVTWLIANQNTDGGWGTSGYGKISTTRDTHDGMASMIAFINSIDLFLRENRTKRWRFSEILAYSIHSR